MRGPTAPGWLHTDCEHANHAGGVLGTFDWETKSENLDNEQLLAILADADDTPADEDGSAADECCEAAPRG